MSRRLTRLRPCLVVLVLACSGSSRPEGPLDAQPERQDEAGATGAGETPNPACLTSQETFLAMATMCRRTLMDTLTPIDMRCAGPAFNAPVIARCPGRITVAQLDSQVSIGTLCTYDEATGAFLGGRFQTDTPFHCGRTSSSLDSAPVVEPCRVSSQDARYCGHGVSGMPVDSGPARPVMITLRNQTGRPIQLAHPDGDFSWEISAPSLDVHRQPRYCHCPNHHCILQNNASGALSLAPDEEVSWSWDGRTWTASSLTGTSLSCEQPALAPPGPMTIRVRYDSEMIEATFDNPPAGPVIMTAQ